MSKTLGTYFGGGGGMKTKKGSFCKNFI